MKAVVRENRQSPWQIAGNSLAESAGRRKSWEAGSSTAVAELKIWQWPGSRGRAQELLRWWENKPQVRRSNRWQQSALHLPAVAGKLLKEKKLNKSRIGRRTTTPPLILTHSITYLWAIFVHISGFWSVYCWRLSDLQIEYSFRDFLYICGWVQIRTDSKTKDDTCTIMAYIAMFM